VNLDVARLLERGHPGQKQAFEPRINNRIRLLTSLIAGGG
jgi:hypothetical protein